MDLIKVMEHADHLAVRRAKALAKKHGFLLPGKNGNIHLELDGNLIDDACNVTGIAYRATMRTSEGWEQWPYRLNVSVYWWEAEDDLRRQARG